MAAPPDVSKDAALRAVGRTIVNFQRLEHNLKRAAKLGPLQGTFEHVQRDIERRHKRAESLTLGQAIQAWLTYCDGTQVPSHSTPDLFDVSIQTTFVLESDAESRLGHAKALAYLLETRNDLIHARLVRFPWELPDACDRLTADVAKVNDDIAEQMSYITSLIADIAALHKEAADVIAAECGVESKDVADT